MESLVAICPPDVDPIVLEVEAMGRRRDVSGDIRESVQLLECRGVHTLRTLASITKPEKGKAGVEVGNCDLATAGGQRTTELWEHDLGTTPACGLTKYVSPRSKSIMDRTTSEESFELLENTSAEDTPQTSVRIIVSLCRTSSVIINVSRYLYIHLAWKTLPPAQAQPMRMTGRPQALAESCAYKAGTLSTRMDVSAACEASM